MTNDLIRLTMSSMLAIFGIMVAIIPAPRTVIKTALTLSAFIASGVVFYHQVFTNLAPWPSYSVTAFMVLLVAATLQYGKTVTSTNQGRRHDDV